MRRAAAVLGAAMIMVATAASAQKPDFSGKWTVDEEKTSAANPAPQGDRPGRGGPGGMMGGPMTIKLDAAAMVIERETPNGAFASTYKLDGSESTVSMGQREVKATAKWEGNTIVVVTAMPGRDGNTTTSKAVYALEGDYLVVTTTRQGPNGENIRKAFYKKS